MSNSCLLSQKTLVILLKNYDVKRLNRNSRSNVLAKFSKRAECPACEEDNVLNITAGITKRAQLFTALTALLPVLSCWESKSHLNFLNLLGQGGKVAPVFVVQNRLWFYKTVWFTEKCHAKDHMALDLSTQISKFPLKLNYLEQALA